LKKKDECVNSLLWFGNLFLYERIQQGYDLNPGISVRFGSSANHRIPFLNCTCSAARSFAGGCRNGVFQNSHHQNQAQEENFYRRFEQVISGLRNSENYHLLQFLDVMDSFEETLI